MRRIFNLILIVSVLHILTGCGNNLDFSDCAEGNCTIEKTYEVLDEFINEIFDEEKKEVSIEGLDLRYELDVFDDYYYLQLYYTNTNDDYLNGYDNIPQIYDVFLKIETKLIQLDITKQFELKVELKYTKGGNYFAFATSEIDNYRSLNIISNDVYTSLGDYLEDNIIHFDDVLTYGDKNFGINMIFAATANPIKFTMDKGQSEVSVRISDEINDKEGCMAIIKGYVSTYVDSRYTIYGE